MTMVKSNDLKDNDEILKEIVIAFGKSCPWRSDLVLHITCIHCGCEKTDLESKSIKDHKEDCAWLKANKLVQEIESGHFDLPRCRYYAVQYAELEMYDEYFYCTEKATENEKYCKRHAEALKNLNDSGEHLLCSSCFCPKNDHFGDGCWGPNGKLGECKCWGFQQ